MSCRKLPGQNTHQFFFSKGIIKCGKIITCMHKDEREGVGFQN